MAQSFNGSSQMLKARAVTGEWATAWPITMFCRAKSTNTTGEQVALGYVQSNSPYNGLLMGFNGHVGGDPLGFSRFGVVGVNSSVGYTSGVWRSWAGRASSNTVFDIDAEGTVDTGATTSVSWPASAFDVEIGSRLTPSISLPLNGDVASVAMWNVSLTDADEAQLIAGFSPRRVRPQSLVFYAPLVRELVAPKFASAGVTWTNTGAVAASAHPRSYGI